jgi:hypothetical protein
MDYTPISTRRVLVAFTFTVFVALLPVFYLVLHGGADSLPLVGAGDGPSGDLLLAVGSAVLTAALIGVSTLVVAIGRRLVRRPARA